MPIGSPFVILFSVHSTNKYAMQEVHDQLSSHGKAYFAIEQTDGRGQMGKSWRSASGENIILSVVWHMDRPFPENPFLFSAAIALGCYDFFNKYAGDDTSLKWPNDLYWGDRKAGGILIENSLKGSTWRAAITGMGININQTRFDPSIANPVSLKQITGKTFDPIVLAKELCRALEQRNIQWEQDPLSLLKDYNSVLYKREKQQTFTSDDESFEGFVKEVDEKGRLILLCPGEKAFNFGTLVWH